jgi:hypothetical protein
VKEYLPENYQKDYDRPMRNAYAMNNYAEAKGALQKIFRQQERINPSAARSLEEGLEETLTVHRLGIGEGVAAEPGHHQSDRIVLVDGAAGGAKRKTPSVLTNVVAKPPRPARIFPVTGERWAQIGITAQFLIVVRTLGEFFRLRHVLGTSFSAAVAAPYVGGALIAACFCWPGVALYFFRRYTLSVWIALAAVVILLVYKIAVIGW